MIGTYYQIKFNLRVQGAKGDTRVRGWLTAISGQQQSICQLSWRPSIQGVEDSKGQVYVSQAFAYPFFQCQLFSFSCLQFKGLFLEPLDPRTLGPFFYALNTFLSILPTAVRGISSMNSMILGTS